MQGGRRTASWRERAGRRYRELRIVPRSFFDRSRPINVHLIPTRRCNLSCAYCNEYDHTSAPVPLPTMLDRVDQIAALGTSVLTLSGGEPMMHPDLDAIIRRTRERDMLAGMTTNGFYLNVDRIERLNRAGLQYLQISIDNVEPDDVSQKSLKTLDRRLQWLSETATFHVNINSVVGGDMQNPQDALAVARRAAELGFSTSVGLLHDSQGQLRALSPEEKAVYAECVALGAGFYTRINRFQRNLIEGKPNDWRCLAGARFLYVDEDGLVHWCSQQRGYPGIPLEKYGRGDLVRERATIKECAPMCTIGCVQRVCAADNVLFRIQGKPEPVATITS